MSRPLDLALSIGTSLGPQRRGLVLGVAGEAAVAGVVEEEAGPRR